jgi:hypothetical protein
MSAISRWAAALSIMACACALGAARKTPPSKTWWKSESIRILVDKVFALPTPTNEILPDDYAVIRDVGFNVICPRWGAEDDDRIRRDLPLAERNDLFYLVWLRGTHTAPKGDLHSLTWADGTVQNLYSPNAPALWDRLEERILAYARLSRGAVLKGVFLDFENYAQNSRGNGYSLSYDRPTLDAFASRQKVDIPDLPPAERRPWLERNRLHDAFEQWQRGLWREHARQLRRRVDSINPEFLFVVYPFPGTPFLYEAAPEWATARAPAVIASAATYRGSQFPFDDRYALERNAAEVRREISELKARKFPFLYIGGIDPIVSGADPEFCGKNASVTCRNSNGYWVFYEGPAPDSPEHHRCMAWFSRANQDIISGCYQLWQMPRRNQAAPAVARAPGVHSLAILGEPRDSLFKVFADAPDFKAHALEAATPEYLQQFDLIILQDLEIPAKYRPPLHALLRRYVEQGGGLLLAHKTLTQFGAPLQDILAGVVKPPPGAPASGGFVDDATMIVIEDWLSGFARGERFDFHWGPHPVLRAGPGGRVILRDKYGEPTVVVGEHGRGRAAFVAPHLGRGKMPTPRQAEFTLALSRWLVSR